MLNDAFKLTIDKIFEKQMISLQPEIMVDKRGPIVP